MLPKMQLEPRSMNLATAMIRESEENEEEEAWEEGGVGERVGEEQRNGVMPVYETLRAWLLMKTQEEIELKARTEQALALRKEARVLFEESEVEAFEFCSDVEALSGTLKQLVSEWFNPYSRAIRQKQKEIRSKGRKYASTSVLPLLPADILAITTIQTILHMLKAYSQENGLGLTTLTEQIGLAVQKEADTLKESYHKDIWRALKSRTNASDNPLDIGAVFEDPEQSLQSRFDQVKRGKRAAIQVRLEDDFIRPG